MTTKKQTFLAVVTLLLLQATWGQAQTEVILFKLESVAAVYNGPSQRTVFTLTQPALITKIWTYHWNNGRGANPGRIGLKNVATGQTVGMWNVTGTYHMFNSAPAATWPARGDGPPFLYWTVQPNVNVSAGTYEVVDSDRDTWASNAEMRNMGCAWVYGVYGGRAYGPSPGATPEVNPQPTYGGIPAVNVAGTWSSDDGSIGSLTISQSGSNVNMRYTHSNGRVIGQLRGNVFEGYWMQDSGGRRCSNPEQGSYYWGRMVFTFHGDAYTGKWGYCDDVPGSGFRGNRTGEGYTQVVPSLPATPEVQPTPRPEPTTVDVNGIWKSGNQTFIFYQEGQTIKVIDAYRRGAQIVVWYGEGTIRGNQVRYRLHHTRNTAPDAEDGIHEFAVSPDSNTMNGTWGTIPNPRMGNWSLQRVGP